MSSSKRSVEVIFIRHAESEENVKAQYLHDLFIHIFTWRLPTWTQLTYSIRLLQLDEDSPVSDLGKRQLLEMKLYLQSHGFWKEKLTGFDQYSSDLHRDSSSMDRAVDTEWMIAYSPLQRAKETCFSLLPDAAMSILLSDETRSQKQCLFCCESLKEIHPLEQLLPGRSRERVESFEADLHRMVLERPHLKRIILVGHCQFFNKLLRMKTRMRNCDVWQATYQCTGDSNERWTELQLLHRSSLTLPHPLDRLLHKAFSILGISSNRCNESTITGSDDAEEQDFDTYEQAQESTASSSVKHTQQRQQYARKKPSTSYHLHDNEDEDSVENDLDDEPLCRICQLRQSETPEMRMIRPCLCTGTVSHVHLDCLNQWRATSTAAFYTCSICKYSYRIERTWFAKLLMEENAVWIIAIIMILALSLFVGMALLSIISLLGLPIDPIAFIYDILDVNSIFGRCNRRVPIMKVIQNIYSKNHGLYNLIYEYYRLIRSPLLMMHVMCHPFASSMFHLFFVGAIMVGTTGLFHFFFNLLNQIRQGGGQWHVQGGILVVWMASLGVKAMSRLCLVVGCLIAARELYSSLVVRARTLSHWLGDRILEPHVDYSN